MALKQTGTLAGQYVRERRQRQEISASSAKTMRYVLFTFVDVVGWDTDPARITRRHVQKWLSRNVSAGTLRSHFSVVRGFCRWLAVEGYARRDVTIGLTPPREPERMPRGLKLAQVQSVLDACPDARWRLVILLMAQEALRCCEVAGLELGDVDLEDGSVFVRNGKGGNQRVVALSDETAEALESYLAVRGRRPGPLIASDSTARLVGVTPKHISATVGKIMHSVGVEETAHALRHTAITDMLRAGAHVRDAQRAAGHRRLSTTETYMPWLVGDLKRAMGGRRYGKRGTPPAEAEDDDAA